MRNTLLLAFIFAAIISEAQIARISVKAGVNYPTIQTATVQEDVFTHMPWYIFGNPPRMPATLKYTFDTKMSFELGGTVDLKIKPRFLVTTGLTVSMTRFKREATIDNEGYTIGGLNVYLPISSFHGTPPESPSYLPDPLPYPTLFRKENTGKTNIVYLQIPILLGTSFFNDKLLVRGGGTFSYSPYSSEYKLEMRPSGGYVEYKETNPDEINRFLASVSINTTYFFTKRIGVDFSVSRSLSSIYKSYDINYTSFSFGVIYSLKK